MLLSKFLHFANNNDFDPEDPNRDRLYKIRQVTTLLRQQWKTVFTPGKNLCVDESLVLFKGRLAFKQYIRTKRSRFGVKFYSLCTDNGITLDTLIYSGHLEEELDPLDGFLSTEKIPITLMRDYLHKGRVLYVDNYYMTPRLCKKLLDNDTYTVGTVRSNRRGFSKDLAAADIAKGTSMFYQCDDMLAVKYRAVKNKSDGKPKIVHMLTTKHTNVVAPTKKKDRDGEVIKKPQAVIDYNMHMGGVDMVDQQLHQIQALRKTYKWYRKIFFRLLLQTMLNSHKLYQMHGGKQDFLGFLQKLVTIMISSTPRLVRNPRQAPQDNLFRLTGHSHFPIRRPLPEESQRQKAKFKTKSCRVCIAKGIPKPTQTQWVCKNCPGEPGLHLDECFEIFHTTRNLGK